MAIYKIYPWYKKSDGGSYMIPSWSTGTDAEIVEALQKHYAGEIDLHQAEGWEIGAERTVTLSGINDGADETIVMVLMNKGGKTLNTSINGHTECAFIVGQKDCLSFTKPMNSTNINTVRWDGCELRTWCNSIYKNAFPSTILNAFKQHINITGISDNNTENSVDYFGIATVKEIGASSSTSYFIVEQAFSPFEYYNTQSNRIKKKNTQDSYYWTRSSNKNKTTDYIYIGSNGSGASRGASNGAGIAPFGVI